MADYLSGDCSATLQTLSRREMPQHRDLLNETLFSFAKLELLRSRAAALLNASDPFEKLALAVLYSVAANNSTLATVFAALSNAYPSALALNAKTSLFHSFHTVPFSQSVGC